MRTSFAAGMSECQGSCFVVGRKIDEVRAGFGKFGLADGDGWLPGDETLFCSSIHGETFRLLIACLSEHTSCLKEDATTFDDQMKGCLKFCGGIHASQWERCHKHIPIKRHKHVPIRETSIESP